MFFFGFLFFYLDVCDYVRGMSQDRFGQVRVVPRKDWHETQIGIGHVGVG